MALLCLFSQSGSVQDPGKSLRDMEPQKLLICFLSAQSVAPPSSPVVHQLTNLVGVECEIVVDRPLFKLLNHMQT